MELRAIFAALAVPARLHGNSRCSDRARNRVFGSISSGSQCMQRQVTKTRYWRIFGRCYTASYASSARPRMRKTPQDSMTTPITNAKAARTKTPTEEIFGPKPSSRSQVFFSSTSVPAKTPIPGHSAVPSLSTEEKLNPPLFTYAPDISVPARRTGQTFFSYAYNAGRAYLTFYKTGISNVRQTAKFAKELRTKARETSNKRTPYNLTRAEWQVVRRSRKDVLRLPAFGALIVLLGEWLPLIVLYITPLIPEACRIPQQVNRSLQKIEDRRSDRLRNISLDAARLMLKDRKPVRTGAEFSVAHFQHDTTFLATSDQILGAEASTMTLFELLFLSAKYDCHSRIWDWVSLYPPKWLLRWSVRRTLEYLKVDDELIKRDGGWAALGEKEVKRACVERGVSVVNKREHEIRAALASWWEVKSR